MASPLLKIRAERDRLSAIERRIGDFVLENAHLLRDYSSQQLAGALGISQSSVVKFSQKLGFRGYPDLKFSVGESVAREREPATITTAATVELPAVADALWQGKSQAEAATRSINPQPGLQTIAAALHVAGRVVVVGSGEDNLAARAFAMRLSLLGVPAAYHPDPTLAAAQVAGLGEGDLLALFSEQGQQPALLQLARLAHERGARVLSATRHSSNPLRTRADHALLVSAHDAQPHVAMLLYHSALQQLLDILIVQLCAMPGRQARLADHQARMRRLLDP
ncbi:MurR/RpiR family transcriptional regulator [Luteimonas fraxinea]|uniref:MurR/RpiR family transcriptional regulator n=1 Tax=Luteimonas fraxinea TaxID=2901869 RepID=A0ABS8UER7_9GAMM|nr:MurR/RpiR family transcriptional regulator [Luteimonas fraxinea]MCD9097015.1 MurR/RpiR family transcriptional regulator [Luteimonas fraxinea]MCD9126648.1 MurR/RpiR family transcriptional regulator [Luteimonas fraxinea]UHH11954.1 MurR/RpiR family transcriptional regulator [Luteimonas fraxinea]